MKTSKIITTIITLNLVLFMSVSSIANSFSGNTGDIAKKSAVNQIEAIKSTISESTPNVSSVNEFSHLRFDVNKFNTDEEVVDLPLNSMDYLRFDASNFYISSYLFEMPFNEFDYLRFDVNSFNDASEISEMPFNEFDYLRFDVSKFSIESSFSIVELPLD